jgi:hypothetical protein
MKHDSKAANNMIITLNLYQIEFSILRQILEPRRVSPAGAPSHRSRATAKVAISGSLLEANASRLSRLRSR